MFQLLQKIPAFFKKEPSIDAANDGAEFFSFGDPETVLNNGSTDYLDIFLHEDDYYQQFRASQAIL